ncbi:MAG: TRAP transporter small permease [Woeseiaceae bacterium]|nr:TRAP transporter small permease [Woeseiaceae bacterium]
MQHALIRALRTLDTVITAIEKWSLAAGVLGMTAVSVANVFMRNVLGESLVFADEVNQALIILVTFIGVGYAAREGRHIRMTAIYDQLGLRARKTMMIIIATVTALLLFALAAWSTSYVAHVQRVSQVTPALGIPLYLVYLVAPVGLTLGGIQYLMTAVRNLVADEVYVSFDRKDEYGAGEEEIGGQI